MAANVSASLMQTQPEINLPKNIRSQDAQKCKQLSPSDTVSYTWSTEKAGQLFGWTAAVVSHILALFLLRVPSLIIIIYDSESIRKTLELHLFSCCQCRYAVKTVKVLWYAGLMSLWLSQMIITKKSKPVDMAHVEEAQQMFVRKGCTATGGM